MQEARLADQSSPSSLSRGVRPTSDLAAEYYRRPQTSSVARRESIGAEQRWGILIAPAVHSWYISRRHKDCSLW